MRRRDFMGVLGAGAAGLALGGAAGAIAGGLEIVDLLIAGETAVVGAAERFGQFRIPNIVATNSGALVTICQARNKSRWSDRSGQELVLRASRDAMLQRAAEEPDLTWRVLTTLNAFRALIAVALLVLFFAGGEPRVFGDQLPTIFWITAAGYLLAAIIFAFALRQRWFGTDLQAVSQSLVDIAAVVILMHTSGGIASGLGGLLIVFVGAASLVLPRQIPTVLAAVATFAILGQQAFSQIGSTTAEANYPAAGILSAVIFAIALATR